MRTPRRCLAVWLLLCAVGARAETVRVTVLHTNDIHGWILPRKEKEEPHRLVGGMAALSAAVARERAAGPVLLLDAGDWFQGTPEGTLPRGKALAELFNALGYDALAVGNHDYDFGEANLRSLVAQLRMPVLGANVLSRATGKTVDYLHPYVIKEVSGIKVGIFGLLTTNMPHLSFGKNIAGLEFAPEAETAQAMVAELRRQGADVVILLSHVGYEAGQDPQPFLDDKEIAAKVAGIDLIVGGHSHTLLKDGFKDPVHGTLIVQAGSYLTHMGKAVLEFDTAAKKVVSASESARFLVPGEPGEDPAVKAIVARYEEEIGRALDVVVATATAALHRERAGESSLGDWITDCERDWAGTQLAFQNSGGIRADLEAGPVRLRDLFSIMPFDNLVTTMTMSGSQLLAVLERGVSGKAGIIQVSGLRLRYRPDAPVGSRLSEAQVDGRPVAPDGRYTASAPDFMVQGGDGYTGFAGAAQSSTGLLLRDVLVSCAREHPSIGPAALDRIHREGP